MPFLLVTSQSGEEQKLEVDAGQSIMETLRDHGYDTLLALCGGCCSCATCHVYVDPANAADFPEMSEDESDLLDSSEYRSEHSRLSCQLILAEDAKTVRITIAPAD